MVSHLDIEHKILNVLRDNPKGLGYNELKRKIPEKSLRKYLPKLIKREFVTVKKKTVRGGTKNVHFLSDTGKIHLELSRDIQNAEKEFREKFGILWDNEDSLLALSFEKKLRLYEKIVLDIVNTCVKMDSKLALQFLNLTLSVAQSVKDKKLSDMGIEKKMLEAEKRAFLKRKTSG